jgi:hypothetical protein
LSNNHRVLCSYSEEEKFYFLCSISVDGVFVTEYFGSLYVPPETKVEIHVDFLYWYDGARDEHRLTVFIQTFQYVSTVSALCSYDISTSAPTACTIGV